MPAGQRSGSHAESVWPYLEETRQPRAEEAEVAPPAKPPVARSASWGQRLLACLRGDRELT